jgi:hypothetical protein
MRAHTEGKDKMGKRFASVIGVAAAGVMALGAQTAAAAPDVVKHDTKLTITHEVQKTDHGVLWHGGVRSEVRKCVEGRRVVLFKERPGADRKLGSDRNGTGAAGFGQGPRARGWSWGVRAPTGGRVYAKAKETPVCRAGRSRTVKNGGRGYRSRSRAEK